MVIQLETKEKYIEQMVEKYANMVYRLALTRVRKKEEAEDIFQEVFLRLLKKMPQFESETHEKAWLIRVTVNCSKTFLTNLSRKKEVPLEEDIPWEKEEKEIYFEVQKLPPKYRTVLYLYYYEGYSVIEIGNMLNMNENTVKTRLSRAREKLKLEWEGGKENE